VEFLHLLNRAMAPAQIGRQCRSNHRGRRKYWYTLPAFWRVSSFFPAVPQAQAAVAPDKTDPSDAPRRRVREASQGPGSADMYVAVGLWLARPRPLLGAPS
jgi:hypothetical protein